MNKIVLIYTLLILSLGTQAQKKDRYRFAETYFGFEAELNPQNGSFYKFENNLIQQAKTPSTLSPRFLIGGTHFWGHADFYISIPFYDFKLNGSKDFFQTNGVLTAFRFLPWKLKSNALLPFAGVGFNAKSIRIDKSALYGNSQWFFEGGLSYRSKKNKVFGLNMRYFPQSNYYASVNRNQLRPLEVDPFSFSLSYKTVIDFSGSYSLDKYKRYYQQLKEDLAESNNLNTYSIGIGVTALIPLEKTKHASKNVFLNDEIEGNVSLDLGLAYFLHKQELAFRMSYRPLTQKEEAYDYTYQLNRHSLAFEAFKFIGDYHGFIPFIGPYVSADYYHLKENDRGQKITDLERTNVGYGLVFGWDIRFSETDPIILRTNLRYNPDYKLKDKGLSFTAKNLEFNFIQLVIYPERIKANKKLSKKWNS